MIVTALCQEVERRHAQQTWRLLPALSEDRPDDNLADRFCEATVLCLRLYGNETPDLDELEAARAKTNGTGGPHAVTDVDVIEDIMSFIRQHAPGAGEDGGWVFIEPLGGVMTPSFTGLPHAEVYQPLGFPVVFVGSAFHNGVSLTISAFESLKLRGYNVVAVVLFRSETYKNHRYLAQYFRRRHPSVPILVLPERPIVDNPDSGDALEEYLTNVYESNTFSPLIPLINTLF